MIQKSKIPQPLPVKERRKLYALFGGQREMKYFTGRMIWLTQKQKTVFMLTKTATLIEILESDTTARYESKPTNQIFVIEIKREESYLYDR